MQVLTLTSTPSALKISNKDTSKVISQLLQLWCQWQVELKKPNKRTEIVKSCRAATHLRDSTVPGPKTTLQSLLKVPGHCSSVIPDKRKTTYILILAPIAAAVFNCGEITPQI